MGPLLYSTNPYLKYFIQKVYRGDRHWVWCSEHFDTTKISAYGPSAGVPPSSDPHDLYKRLRADIVNKDTHSRLVEQHRRATLKHAVRWYNAGEIDEGIRDEIVYQAKHCEMSWWRPLVYVIPRAPVEGRLKRVAAENRAGLGNEWQLQETLRGNEFDVIELG